MLLRINGFLLECGEGMCWRDAISFLPKALRDLQPLGVTVRGNTYALSEKICATERARILSYADEEGRRIYERSLQLLLITAVHRLRPDARVRIEHSYGSGVYVCLRDEEMSEAFVNEIEQEMRALAEANLPIKERTLATAQAKAYYERAGQADRSSILRYRSREQFKFYSIGNGPEDYFYGRMLTSTGEASVFKLVPRAPGLVMMLPDVNNPSLPAEYVNLPKLWNVYQESAHWNEILGIQNVSDLNKMVDSGRLREFIRVNEALQEKKIQAIADAFERSGARVILVAGPSSSGKTTFSHRLSIALRVLGHRPVKLSLDDYYLDRDTLPLEPDGTIDLERIETLDTQLISDHLVRLLNGETVPLPEFDFTSGKRTERTHDMYVEPGQPIIIEGIHGLNDRLTEGIPREMKFKVYISALTMLNLDDHNRIRSTDARLLRRIVRDYQFRGTKPEATIEMWKSVRKGEESYIFPFAEDADMTFNSALSYELCIMKKYAYPALKEIDQSSPHYTLANRLVKFLNYIRIAEVEDEIPVNSLLREFIGGCCFYRETD